MLGAETFPLSGNGEDIVSKKKIDIDSKIQLVVNKIQNRVTTRKLKTYHTKKKKNFIESVIVHKSIKNSD